MECLWYLVPMSVVHLLLFLVYCPIFGSISWPRLRHIALFFGLLLIAGSIFNGLWSCMIYGRLYDSADYIFDFTPFCPITKGLINETFGNHHGRLLGVALWQLNLVWLLFALGTWSSTICLYRLICKQWPFSMKALFRRPFPSKCGA